jgi:hypothetical protein
MTGRNFDTDPSTPGAIHGTTGDTDPAGAAELKRPNTDPGLGPAGPPGAPAALRPLPVRVPPVGKQDSVEMLLDNMSEPQPERQKTTPRSAGEAAASYHAEHPVHPARTEPDEEPKVIVERPPLAPTVRVQRGGVQAMIEQADAMRRAAEAEAEAEAEAAAQAPVPVTMGPRVLIAAVAGLVVVLVIFVVARGIGAGTARGVAATATATTAATAAATATATATATAAATIPVGDTTGAPAPPATVHVPVTALPTAPPTAPAATAKPRPRPASTGTSGDLGEFKPTFH